MEMKKSGDQPNSMAFKPSSMKQASFSAEARGEEVQGSKKINDS
jgi:hypothetical protein